MLRSEEEIKVNWDKILGAEKKSADTGSLLCPIVTLCNYVAKLGHTSGGIVSLAARRMSRLEHVPRAMELKVTGDKGTWDGGTGAKGEHLSHRMCRVFLCTVPRL